MGTLENVGFALNVTCEQQGLGASNIIVNMIESGQNFLMHGVGVARSQNVGAQSIQKDRQRTLRHSAIIEKLQRLVKCAAFGNVSNGIIQITGCLF